jgi:glycosyltransferase involved in cell wall biosynthesis
MLVSVVIPTYNRRASLLAVIQALRRQTFGNFEVLVVNGPSTDGTAELLASLGEDIRKVENADRNLSRSRNLGIAAAAGDLVAFLDDDAVPQSRWLEELIAPFGDADVAGTGGLVLDHTGVRVQWRHLVVSRAGDHDFDRLPPLDRFVVAGADPFLYLAGGNSAFRRAALTEVEGFDEEIEYNFDEAEVCLRLLDAGWRLESLETAVVHHGKLPSDQRTATAFTDPFLEVKNRVYFGLRHAPDRGTALISANRGLAQLRVLARIAARSGRLSGAELAHYLGRADAGFHVGLQRGNGGERKGRRFGPSDPAAFRRFPTLAPSPRRRVVVADAAAARALADAGHEVHLLRLAEPQVPYRIDFDDGVWRHAVPVRRRWLPELDGSPLRGPLEAAAALRGALAAVRRSGPVELELAPPQPLDGFLDASVNELAALIRCEGIEPAAAARAACRLLEPDRFPTDHEPGIRACLAEPDDERFVERLYNELLGRTPEEFGRRTAVARLRAGDDRLALVEEVACASEARGRGVNPAFVARLPTVSVTRARAALREAWPLRDAQFARRVHALLLGTDAGAGADAARLAGGLRREALVRELAARPGVAERIPGADLLPPEDARTRAELRAGLERLARLPARPFAAEAHRFLLGRAPEANETERLGALLADGQPRAGIVRALAGSPEGRARGVPLATVRAALARSPRYRLDELRRFGPRVLRRLKREASARRRSGARRAA